MKSSDLTGNVRLLLTKAKLPDEWRQNGAQALRDVFEDAGYRTELTLCDDPNTIREQITNNSKPGDIVAVGGGDGTINAILDAVISKQAVLIPIPLGTANDFARTLTLPDDLIDAARASIHGQIRMLDVGYANDQSFINAASIGVPADARKRINPDLKRNLGAISYAVANWQSWHEMAPMDLSITCGTNSPQNLKLRQLTITNGRYFGGGLRPSERKSPEDGLLHMFAIRDSVDTLSGLDVAAELLFGSVDDSEFAMTMECDAITINGEDGAPILADGEIISKLPAKFSIRAGALAVFAPNSFVGLPDQTQGEEHTATLVHANEINDVMRGTLDLALRLQATYPVAQHSELKSLCHDGTRALRNIYRQLEQDLHPYGILAASPDPDLHSLEELRDRVIGWLLQDADICLANGLKTRAGQLADQLSDIPAEPLPKDIKAHLTALHQEIARIKGKLGDILGDL